VPEDRESLRKLVALIVIKIAEGAPIDLIAEDLEEATEVAQQLADADKDA
jgi:hypothetical protein